MLVGAESGLSSQRIFPSHAQNFLVFWKRPAERAIIPHVKLCEIGIENQLAHVYLTALSAPSAGTLNLLLCHHHHQFLFPLREIGPSLQASRSFAQLPASVQSLNQSSPRSLSTVLRHGSLGLPFLRLPSGVHVLMY